MTHEVTSRQIKINSEEIDKTFASLLEAEHLNNLALAQMVGGRDYLVIKSLALMTTNCFYTIFCAIEMGKNDSLDLEYKQLQQCMDEMKSFADFAIADYKKRAGQKWTLRRQFKS